MNKYIKVLFEDQTIKREVNFNYKIGGEINIANHWDPTKIDPKEMGGFNFSVENKILRWLIRGDLLCDVIIPDGTEVIEVDSPSAPHGVFRAEKIILVNPRKMTDELAMNFYEKAELPEESLFTCIAICAIREYEKTCKKIIEDKVNKENIDKVLEKYRDFIGLDEEEIAKQDQEELYIKMYKILKEKYKN